MNWLKNFVRPKLQKLVGGGKDIPETYGTSAPNARR